MSNFDRVVASHKQHLPSSEVEEFEANQNHDDQLKSLLIQTHQVLGEIRLLSSVEQTILVNINAGLKSWHKSWINKFLSGGREFDIVYEFMEHLLHYEQQIVSSVAILSNDRTNAIAQAVARLIDCGNATLNIDLIVRADDDTSSELDFCSSTTIQLFKAHLRAQKLREKLLNDYFKHDKRSNSTAGIEETFTQLSLGGSFLNLQLPAAHSGLPSPTLDRSLGSNHSINTVSDGRRTPLAGSQIEVKKLNPVDLSDQLDITHMTATIRSRAFTNSSPTRMAFLPGILANIEDLSTVPTNAKKLTRCFELLDSLLDSLESLSPDQRSKEVSSVAIALLKPLVRKVYIDDRENLVEFQHAHWVAALVSLLRLMTPADFSSFLNHFNNLADLGAFLKDFLFIIKRLMTNNDRTTRVFHSQPDIESIAGLGGPMFPECWIDMILTACSTFLTSLTNLYQILKQVFSSNIQMWSNFIDCLICFNLYDSLKHDRFMLKERQRLLASDLRQTAAEYVWIAWDSLNLDQKQRLLDDLIDPLLMACVCMNSKQRSILLPIFYDMMHCDYTSQYINQPIQTNCSSSSTFRPSTIYSDFSFNTSNKNDDAESLPPIIERSTSKSPQEDVQANSLPYLYMSETNTTSNEDGTVLTRFTHMTVGKLNNLIIEKELGDESFKNDLCAAIAGELDPKYSKRRSFDHQEDSNRFRTMAKLTSDLLCEFMQICLDHREAKKLSYKHLELLCLFRLIQFFKDKVDRAELYLHNLFKLCSLHHKAERPIECALTLLEYAKTLPWSDQSTGSHHRIITRHFQISDNFHTLGGLKSILYSTIIEYFDQGQLWEAAIPLCRELMDLYQFKTFEYEKLSMIYQKLSNYFASIIETGQRSNPEYFRVSFYGLGFPKCIQNTTMVYRGKPFEKLGDFQAHILAEYPDAALFQSLAKPDNSIMNDRKAKLLQINACMPVVDLVAKFGNNLHKLGDQALSYYKFNECDKFQFSRRISRPQIGLAEQSSSSGVGLGDNFGDIWRERTTLTCNTLPGMLAFFPVYLVETSVVSPIECALEDLERTNDRLSCMVNRFKADKRHAEDVRLLGQLLLGIVDAAVNGGIAKYEEAFFSSVPTSQAYRNAQRSLPKRRTSATKMTNASNPAGLYVSLSNDSDDVDFSFYGKQANSNNTGHYEFPADETIDTARNGLTMPETCLATSNLACKPTETQVDKLKCLIARQVPLLDVAIRLHGDRVADVMRPQQEHLESSYKKLKQHVITKYSRYLPPEYKRSYMNSVSNTGTFRSYRSMHKSPSRSMRLVPNLVGLQSATDARSSKRMSDVGFNRIYNPESVDSPGESGESSIPYQQLGRERRSLPFLSGLPRLNVAQVSDDHVPSSPRPLPPTPSRPSHLDIEDTDLQLIPPAPRITIIETNSAQPSDKSSSSTYRDIEGLFNSIGNQDLSRQEGARDDDPTLTSQDDDGSSQTPVVSSRGAEVKLVHL